MDMAETHETERVEKMRREAREWLAEHATAIEQFERTAVPKAPYRDGKFNVTEYTDPVTEGLSSRVFVYRPTSRIAYRKWVFKRPGRRALELSCDEHPSDARKRVKRLLAGDETEITGAYLMNEDLDAHGCQCFRAFDLLQEKTLRELEKEVASNEDSSRCCRIRHIKAALKRYAIFREREGLEIKIKAKPKKREEDWRN